MRAARISLVLLLTCPALAASQTFEVRTYCGQDVPTQAAAGPSHPSALRKEIQPLIESGRWLDAFDAIRNRFEAASVPEAPRSRFVEQLDQLEAALRGAQGVLSNTNRVMLPNDLVLTRFQVTFNVGTGRFHLFEHVDVPLEVTQAWGEAAVRTICWTAFAMDSLLTSYAGPGRTVVEAAIAQHLRLWDAFSANSYSQYPWELYVNGRLMNEASWDPPRTQLVVMHPSIAVQVVRPVDEGVRRVDVIAVEPIGVLRYGDSRTSYVGASALVVLSSAHDAGFGALAHIGRFGKAGWVFRQKGIDGRDRHGPVVSLDLYKLVERTPQAVRTAREQLERLRAGLSK